MIIDCAVYQAGKRISKNLSIGEASVFAREQNGFVWLGLYEPSAKEFTGIASEFGLHELAVQDAVNAHQRPKIEFYSETCFLVVKTVNYVGEDELFEIGELMLFIHKNFLIAVRHGKGNLGEARNRIEQQQELLQHGVASALYAILDHVVDIYLVSAEKLDIEIQAAEESVFTPKQTNPAQRIYQLERETLAFHRAVTPLTAVIDELAHRDSELVSGALAPYFRDVHDHLLRVESRVTALRELLASVLQANLAQISVQQNEDMRKISAWAAILAVPTMLAGIYGMNFKYMPELNWKFSYPVVLLGITVLCLLLYRWFKRSNWL